MPAGYSGTPLWKKLAFDDGQNILALGMPASVRAEIPPEIVTKSPGGGRKTTGSAGTGGPWHAILWFVTDAAELATRLPSMMAALAPATPKSGSTPARRAGFIWIAWPKKTPAKGLEKIATDITEDRIRDIALPLGLVDVKVCAIDGQWSGLQLVIRKT